MQLFHLHENETLNQMIKRFILMQMEHLHPFHANGTFAHSEKTPFANRTSRQCAAAVHFHEMQITYSESAHSTTLGAYPNSIR